MNQSKLEKLNIYYPKRFVKFFRERYLKDPSKYAELERDISSARLPVTVPSYLAITYFYTLLLTPIFALISYFIFANLGVLFSFGENVAARLGVSSPFEKEPLYLVLRIVISIISFLALFFLARYIFFKIPSIISSQRRGKIDAALLHVANIMHGMAKGGMPILEIFKVVAEERQVTGEVGKEFSIILRDIEFFHKDIISAMRNVIDTTPSEKLKEFLEDLISVIKGGGSIVEFLEFKTSHYVEEKERFQDVFISSYEILAEMYVAIFVVAPLFALIIFVVMGLMNETTDRLMEMIVYLYIPLGAIGFLWLLNSMRVEERIAWKGEKVRGISLKVTMTDGRGPNFIERKGTLWKIHSAFTKLKKMIRISTLKRKPEYTFIGSIPLAVVFIILEIGKLSLESLVIFGYIIAILPYVIAYEWRSWRIRKMEKELPNFLRSMGSLNESGLPIVSAIRVLSTSKLGALAYEIINLRKDIEWGKLVTEAFERFEDRIGSGLVSKVVSILNKALEATDNVKAAIFTAANDAEMFLDFRERIRNAMFVYTAIIYITFAVFLFTVVVLLKNFIGVFSSMELNAPTTYFRPPNVDFLTKTFYHAVLINGFFGGIIAGVMSGGGIRDGLKHSVAILVVAVLVFVYALGIPL